MNSFIKSKPIPIPNQKKPTNINNIDNYQISQTLSLPVNNDPLCESDCCFPPNPPNNSFQGDINFEDIICQRIQMSPSKFDSYKTPSL